MWMIFVWTENWNLKYDIHKLYLIQITKLLQSPILTAREFLANRSKRCGGISKNAFRWQAQFDIFTKFSRLVPWLRNLTLILLMKIELSQLRDLDHVIGGCYFDLDLRNLPSRHPRLDARALPLHCDDKLKIGPGFVLLLLLLWSEELEVCIILDQCCHRLAACYPVGRRPTNTPNGCELIAF